MSTLASVVLRDIAANKPAAGIAGRIFYETDTGKIWRDNSASWDDVTPTGGAVGGGASVSLTAQTASVATTNILTPAANGLFEVSVVQFVASAGTAGTLSTTIGWTDEQGAHSKVIATDLDLTNASDQESGSLIIRAKTTAAITYTATVTGATGAPTFDLFIKVRAL